MIDLIRQTAKMLHTSFLHGMNCSNVLIKVIIKIIYYSSKHQRGRQRYIKEIMNVSSHNYNPLKLIISLEYRHTYIQSYFKTN
jgi:hypothetical protein